MRKFVLTVFLIIISQMLSAQDKFYSGYIITSSGDTVSGYIKYQNWDFNPDKIIFKKSLSATEGEIFGIKEMSAFVITGLESYERCECNISMDYTDINFLSIGPSHQNVMKSVFLKRINISPSIDFYVYRDIIKERYFIKEGQDSIPSELIYRAYYKDKNDNAIVKEENFKKDIIMLIDKYAGGNKSYKKSVNYLNYERIPLNAILLKIVNGKTITNAKRDTLAEPRKTRIAFFLQAGANAYHYKSKQSSFLTNFSESGINYSPVLGAGVDIVPNKFRSWYFVRMEINYTSSKYESKRSQTVLDNIFQYSSSINESILTFLPSFNWFIHQSTNSKIFLGVGISYSYSPSVKNFSTTKIYNLSGVQVGENSSYVKNSASWLGLNIMPGVILNDKLHITGGLIIGRVGNEKFSSLTAATSVHLKFGYYFYSR